jgi:hypothetical protein
VENGDYLIRVSFAGYELYNYGRLAVTDAPVSLPDVVLTRINTVMKEFTVAVQKPFIEVFADKLVVNVENSIVNTGSSVMEVLARSPGITVDQNDQISLKGKQGTNVMIDGRLIPVSQTELANMLKSMPSASVEKIEIISNPSSKYDAAGTAGIINIKTKKDKKMGINGSVNFSHSQGVYSKDNLGGSMNYRNRKLNIYASLNTNNSTGFSEVDWNRRFSKNGLFTGAYYQVNYTRLNFKTTIASAGMDYNLSGKTVAGVSVSGESFYMGTVGSYFARIYDSNDSLVSYNQTSNTSGGTWTNVAPNVHIKHTFDSLGKEISVDVDYAAYGNSNQQDFTTKYLALNSTEYQPRYLLHGTISGNTQISSLKADFVNPLKNGTKIEAGIKTSFVKADNEPQFYNRSNGGNQYEPGFSDHYIYEENINAAYVNASKDWKKFSSQIGVRAEQTIIKGNEVITGQTFADNYIRIFPSLAFQAHINEQNDLGITLSRRIERPGYRDLNPYIFFVDPTTYKTGNPQLQPAFTWSAELSYTYKQRFITTLSCSKTDNVITEVIKPSTTQDKVTIQTKDNLATMYFYGISGAYTIPIRKWWTNVINFDAYYAQYTGNLSNTYMNEGKPTFDINTNNKFTLPKDFSAELTVFYQSAQVYGFLNLTPISMFNLGIQKNLLDKKLTIKVFANDIFWHGNESGSSYFINYAEVFHAKHDTRVAGLAITYRFGKKAAPVQKHSGGAEDEKKRASEKGA